MVHILSKTHINISLSTNMERLSKGIKNVKSLNMENGSLHKVLHTYFYMTVTNRTETGTNPSKSKHK